VVKLSHAVKPILFSSSIKINIRNNFQKKK